MDYESIFKTGPIIICGMYSGGTTLLAQLLQAGGVMLDADKHNYVFEGRTTHTHVNQRILKGLWWAPTIQKEQDILNRVKKEEKEMGFTFKSVIHKKFISKNYKEGPWGWKDPKNSILLPAIYKMFPNMTLVHIVRDGRDNAISLQNRHNPGDKETDSTIGSYFKVRGQKECFSYWINLWEQFHRRVMKYGKGCLRSSYFRVKYEDLCNEEIKMVTIEKLFKELKLEVTDKVRAYVEKDAGKKSFPTAESMYNSKRYPNFRPDTVGILVGKWKKLPSDIVDMLNKNKLMKELEYV